jgi:hypothetical protein
MRHAHHHNLSFWSEFNPPPPGFVTCQCRNGAIYDEYNEIMRKYNKSIKEYYDANNKKVVIRSVTKKNNDKFMAYLHYYNYKKLTKDKYT